MHSTMMPFNNNILAVTVSSVSSFILSSVISLALGRCCCYVYTRYKKKCVVERTIEVTETSTPMVIYEDLLPSVPKPSKENELVLSENMAYSSTEIKWHSKLPS